jgi:predicted component of type VI protein secretion system
MNDLQRQLATLHDALRGARHLEADERAALESVLDDIQRVLDSSAGEPPGAEHGDTLESAAVRLEAGHPGLAGAIRSVLDALAKAGI